MTVGGGRLTEGGIAGFDWLKSKEITRQIIRHFLSADFLYKRKSDVIILS